MKDDKPALNPDDIEIYPDAMERLPSVFLG
jgi:hypothetical protein